MSLFIKRKRKDEGFFSSFTLWSKDRPRHDGVGPDMTSSPRYSVNTCTTTSPTKLQRQEILNHIWNWYFRQNYRYDVFPLISSTLRFDQNWTIFWEMCHQLLLDRNNDGSAVSPGYKNLVKGYIYFRKYNNIEQKKWCQWCSDVIKFWKLVCDVAASSATGSPLWT